MQARIGLNLDHIEGLSDSEAQNDLGARFEVTRAALGLHGQASENLRTRILFNVIEGETEGWEVQVRDLHAVLSLTENGDHRIRAGVQPLAFGVGDRFQRARTGYLFAGNRALTVAEQAGILDERDLGLTYQSRFSDQQGSFELMVHNGTGSQVRDDNTSKDLSARLRYRLLSGPQGEEATEDTSGPRSSPSGLVAQVSAHAGFDGAQGDDQARTYAVSGEWRSNGFAILSEYLWGDSMVEDSSVPFLVSMSAASLDLSTPGTWLEKVTVVGRFGFHDPDTGLDDASAWMLIDGGLVQTWSTQRGNAAHTLINYDVVVPMDITADVEHGLT
ncbi:MAG: hypothetical protein QGG40_21605, partial [Myxococcota bacterium]|nr:hypothetical protein [Myxococcota bacterium]